MCVMCGVKSRARFLAACLTGFKVIGKMEINLNNLSNNFRNVVKMAPKN